MQTFTTKQRFTQSVETVLEKYTDPTFLQHKYEKMGRENIELLEHERDGDQVRLRLRYAQPMDLDLPDFARRFVSDRMLIVQTSEWRLADRRGELRVEPQGSPAHMQSRMTLSDDGNGGCINEIRWQVSCSIPLLGGKLEKLLVDGLRNKAADDEAVTQALLDQLT